MADAFLLLPVADRRESRRRYGARVNVELLGYAASALVVAALSMKSVVRLRGLSLCGSIAFLVYGVLIESVPIIMAPGNA